MDKLVTATAFERALQVLVVLNAFDMLSTHWWVQGGITTEANPLMAQAMEVGPWSFLLTKMALVTFAVALLWANRDRMVARVAALPLVAAYVLIAGGHVGIYLHVL